MGRTVQDSAMGWGLEPEARPDGGAPRRPPKRAATDWRPHLRVRQRTEQTIAQLATLCIARLASRKSRSLRDARSAFQRIVDAFGSTSARELTPEMIEAWIVAQRIGDRLKENTIAKNTSFLSGLLRTAVEEGAADVNAVRLVSPNVRANFKPRDPLDHAHEALTPPQFSRVVHDLATPLYRRHLYRLALLTGTRFGECAGLNWADIEEAAPLRRLLVVKQWSTKDREIVPDTKEKRARIVPVAPLLEGFLVDILPWFRRSFGRDPRPDDPLAPFPYQRTKSDPITAERWREPTALKWWRRDLQRLEIPPPPGNSRRFHSTRHTLISALSNCEASETAIKAFTHPKSVKVADSAFGVYVHASWEAMCAAMLRLRLPNP